MKNLEIAALVVIILICFAGFLFSHSRSGCLDLDKGAIHYDGSLVRSKMNGKGTVTFKMGIPYTGNLVNGLVMVFKSKDGWPMKDRLVNGQPEADKPNDRS